MGPHRLSPPPSSDTSDLEPLPVDPPGGAPAKRSHALRWRVAAVAVAAALAGGGIGMALAHQQYRSELREIRAELAQTRERHDDLLLALRRMDSRPVAVVPNTLELRLREAQDRLRDAGFRPVALAGEARSPESVVVAQEPAGGLRVPIGSSVGLRTRP